MDPIRREREILIESFSQISYLFRINQREYFIIRGHLLSEISCWRRTLLPFVVFVLFLVRHVVPIGINVDLTKMSLSFKV